MNYKKLENFFTSMNLTRATVLFDDIEQECGEIPRAYMDYKHLDKNYAFHQHIQKAGFHITAVDYENRTFCVERCNSTPQVSIPENTVSSVMPGTERTLTSRRDATYNELVSKAIDRRISRGIATDAELLQYCISKRAFGAATAYEHFVPDSRIICEKEAIVQAAIEKIAQLQPGINYDEWLYTACRDTEYSMRFGIWQKILNITLKFMYLFHCRGGYFADYAWVWEQCHCPVDKIIRNIVVQKIRQDGIDADINYLKNITWNFITEEQYRYFQSVIAQLCEREAIASNMFFDVLYWERP